MCKYRSSAIRKYVKEIKSNDIQNMQKSVYGWYIYIEDIKQLKRRIKRNEDLSTLQQKMEHNREVFFSSEVKTFNKTLSEYI